MSQLMVLRYAFPLALALSTNGLLAADQQAATATESVIGDCSKEFLIAYFPSSLVQDALNKFHVPKEKWDPIIKSLAESEKSIITQVEEKASKITPNPLKDPQQRQVAVKIFRETLTDVFSGVLKKNGITDDKQIHAMLDEIQQQKAKKFAECLDKHRKPSQEPNAHHAIQTDKLQAEADVKLPSSNVSTPNTSKSSTDQATKPSTDQATKTNKDDQSDDDDYDDYDDDDYDDDKDDHKDDKNKKESDAHSNDKKSAEETTKK